MDESLVARLAPAIHEQYRAEQHRDGVADGATPSMVGWDELDEDRRDANRAQARDIERKLSTVGLRLAVGGAPFTFTEGQLEALAIEEHDRWCADRRGHGWVLAPVRDDARKHTPLLVPWAELAEVERDKDRDAVRNIPVVLAAVGYGVAPESSL